MSVIWPPPQAAALALVRGQLESGGWAYLVEFEPKSRGEWAYRTNTSAARANPARRKNTTTFDDDNTQSALRFLTAFVSTATNRSSRNKGHSRGVELRLTKMIEAQYRMARGHTVTTACLTTLGNFRSVRRAVPKRLVTDLASRRLRRLLHFERSAQQDCIRTCSKL